MPEGVRTGTGTIEDARGGSGEGSPVRSPEGPSEPTPPTPLERLLRPRSIAVVGGGPWCEAVLAQCRRAGFAGSLHAVHPHREKIGGLATWPDVSTLPDAPDAAFVGVNRDATVEVVRALAARGAGGAVCFANGFAESREADGGERQAALLEAAGDVALLGPNCYGFVNALDGVALWPDQHGLRRVTRGVALLTQSSNIALNLSMQRRGLPVAYLVTSGNQAQQGFAAIGEALLADRRVTALGLHVEGFGDVRALERLAALAAELGKPIVALKAGRSDAARSATLSHTASLAGSEAGADALMRRLGIARVDTLGALVGALQLLHVHGPLGGAGRGVPGILRLASASCSGGEAALIADAVERAVRRSDAGGGDARPVLPPLGEARRATLGAVLGPRVALANPLDYDTGIWRDADALRCVFTVMTGSDIDLTLLVLDLPRGDRCDPRDWERPIAALERAARDTGARFALVATLPENLPEALALRLVDSGIAPLAGIDEAIDAAGAAATLGASPAGAAARPPPVLLAAAPARAVLATEARAKTLLADAGVLLPRGITASSPAEAAAAATRIGFPVALKGAGVAHKSDIGAVALGLGDGPSVRRAAAAMPCDTFLVESMIGNGVVELLVGVVRDPAHGFVLTIGAGGLHAELLDDRRSLLLPTSAEEVEGVLRRLRIAPRIDGVRGRPGAHRRAIVETVLAVQRFVVENAALLVELEINPLLATPHAAVALDALLVADPAFADPAATGEPDR